MSSGSNDNSADNNKNGDNKKNNNIPPEKFITINGHTTISDRLDDFLTYVQI